MPFHGSSTEVNTAIQTKSNSFEIEDQNQIADEYDENFTANN